MINKVLVDMSSKRNNLYNRRGLFNKPKRFVSQGLQALKQDFPHKTAAKISER